MPMTDPTAYTRPKYVGKPILRLEDPRLLTGQGRYTADIQLPRMAHIAFVRSPLAYAQVSNIDANEAKALPGVMGVFTANDFVHIPAIKAQSIMKNYQATDCSILASDVVRYVGEPVVAIVASSRYIAEDAAALININYKSLEVAVTARAALAKDAPRLHESLSSNVLLERIFSSSDALKAINIAPHSVSGCFKLTRKSSMSTEPRAYLAEYNPGRDELILYGSTNIPGIVRDELAHLLNLNGNQIRVIAPDVGGSFGGKGSLYPEEVIIADLARRLEIPLKYVSDRLEELTSSSQAFGEEVEATLAFDEDGNFLALKAEIIGDIGAYSIYPWTAALEPVQVASFLPGPYKLPAYHGRVRAVCTPKPPTGPYRGVGRPMAVFAMERLVDLAAAKLGISPVEIRRRNMLDAKDFPYRTGSGITWNRSGFKECLEAVEKEIDQKVVEIKKSKSNNWVGIGFASYAELTGIGSRISVAPGMPINTGSETATIRIDSTGAITASFGLASHGQSLETTLAQIIAEELGVKPQDVRIIHGDTAVTPYGIGTHASRSAILGGGAAIKATRSLLSIVKRVAATLFQVSENHVETGNGRIFVPNTNHSIDFKELARVVYTDMTSLPMEKRETLEAQENFDPYHGTTTSSTHAAIVEIDPETLVIKLSKLIVAEDCGKLINPLVVNGQVQGGVAQGIGVALLEELQFDSSGQPVTATLADYKVPTSAEVPSIDIQHIETELPKTPGGFRGMGEGGTIGTPAAIANAVADAVAHLNIDIDTLPITSSKLHEMIMAVSEQGKKG